MYDPSTHFHLIFLICFLPLLICFLCQENLYENSNLGPFLFYLTRFGIGPAKNRAVGKSVSSVLITKEMTVIYTIPSQDKPFCRDNP